MQTVTITDDRGHTLEITAASDSEEPAIKLTIVYGATVTLGMPAVKALAAYADGVWNYMLDQKLLDNQEF